MKLYEPGAKERMLAGKVQDPTMNSKEGSGEATQQAAVTYRMGLGMN